MSMFDEEVYANMVLKKLKHEKEYNRKDGLYAYTQELMAYRSNKSENFTLSPEQVVSIFQTSELEHEENAKVNVNDVLAVTNSFLLFDYMLYTLTYIDFRFCEKLTRPLDAKLIHEFSDITTTRFRPVQHVDIDKEIEIYRSKSPDVEDIVDLYKAYIRSGGDRRVGRMMMFRECLVNGIFPFIITNDDDDVFDAKKDYFNDVVEDWSCFGTAGIKDNLGKLKIK